MGVQCFINLIKFMPSLVAINISGNNFTDYKEIKNIAKIY